MYLVAVDFCACAMAAMACVVRTYMYVGSTTGLQNLEMYCAFLPVLSLVAT